MATNIEDIFRDFVVNKMKEIADETGDNSRIDEPHSEPAAESRRDGLETKQLNTPTAADKETCNDLQVDCGIEANSTKHRKNKKHKKHKSKKKKKRKEEKECGTEAQSDKETQDSGKKKKKRKKKKKSKEADKAKRSGSRSNSSASGSESESESKPSSKNAKLSSADKTSKSELKIAAGLGSSPLPDIIPGMENSVHTSAKDKKRSSSRSSKREQSSKGKRTRSRSPRQKSRHRSRSRSSKRHGRSTSRSRNSPRKRNHQQREKSRSPSRRRNNRSRSRSVRRRRYSRSRSRSRRSRSRSGLTSRKNRRSASKSRSGSRSRSRSRTKHSKSRSESVLKDKQKEIYLVENKTVETVDNSESSAMQTDVSQKTTENGKSPTVAMNLDTKLPETVVISSPTAPVVTGSWRPIPFLGESSENQFSQKCITPEVPLEAIKEPADTSTDIPKDSECVLIPEEKETPASSKSEIQPSTEIDSKSPSKSPSQQLSSKSKLPERSRSKSRQKKSRSSSRNDDKKSKSRSPSEKKKCKSKAKHKRSKSKSPKRSRSRSPSRRKRSRTPDRSRRSKSRRRSRSHSKRRSRSGSRWRRGFGSRSLNQRDRWKREPSRSPVLILRKKRSTSRTRRSTSKTPPRLTELDKEQLLEIAKANAAAMCAKAGVPIPESLRPKNILQLPLSNPNSLSCSLALGVPLMTMNVAMASMTAATMTAALSSFGALASMPQFAPLPTIVNKPPSSSTSNLASIEEAKRKVTKQANNFSIKELTERCKKITESKEEMAIAKPHVSDDEDDEQTFGAGALKETKGIAFSISNTSVKAGIRTEATFAKEFPVSSGSQHRKKEADGAYGEWVPVEKKKTEKPSASGSAGTEESSKETDSVFPEAPSQPVDITVAVSDRAVAQKRLAENPFDINAMCMLNRAQEQVDAWAQSNTIPGLFTGSTGAQVLSSEELSNSGLQAWIKKGQSL